MESSAIWKVEQLLCYLSCSSRKISCFLGGKALGPMPSRRESLQHYAHAFCNISMLLLFASSKLRDATLKPGRRVELLCLAAFPRLVELWELLWHEFFQFSRDIAQWARHKTQNRISIYQSEISKSFSLSNPLNARRYPIMDGHISYVQVCLFEILNELKPLLGTSFVTNCHILMKLGRDISYRRKGEKPQVHARFVSSSIVLPFQNLQYMEFPGLDPLHLNDFKCFFYNQMNSSGPLLEFQKNGYPASCNPFLSSHLFNNGRSHQKLSGRRLVVPQIQEVDIWIGRERTSKYSKLLGSPLLRDIVLISAEGRKFKENVVYLSPTYLLFFRKRGESLILQYEIARADILQVTYHRYLDNAAEVQIFWKTFSKEPGPVAFALLHFDEMDNAKVWAGSLAPNVWPESPKEASVPEPGFFSGTFEITGANFEKLNGSVSSRDPPPSTSSPDDVTIGQVQRILSRVETRDLDLLEYRVISLRDGLEALVISDPSSDKNYAAMDVLLDDRASNSKFLVASAIGIRKSRYLVPFNSEKYPKLIDHLGEYLSKCNGSCYISQEPGYTNCSIEVPKPQTASPSLSVLGSSPSGDFRGALDRFINAFICPKMSPLRGLSSQLAKEYYKLEKMKFLVYGREPLDVLEEWIRDPLLPAKPLSSSSTSTDCPILQKSQFKETAGQVEVQDKSVKNILTMFTGNDEGWKKHWGCLETDDELTGEQILLRKHARAESIVH